MWWRKAHKRAQARTDAVTKSRARSETLNTELLRDARSRAKEPLPQPAGDEFAALVRLSLMQGWSNNPDKKKDEGDS